jgi:hypothetical protein
VLVCSERRVLLAGCWWLVCCERKSTAAWWLISQANRVIIIKLHERWLDQGRCRQIVSEVAYVNSSFVRFEGASLKCISSGWATIYF